MIDLYILEPGFIRFTYPEPGLVLLALKVLIFVG